MKNINDNKDDHRAHEQTIPFGDWAFDLSFDDTKRHAWMINLAQPLFEILHPNSILTLGDDRGREAYFISKFSEAEITASDIGTTKLKIAADLGFIGNYCESDIESLNFPESAFDVTYVKESLHHLPRPLIGLYEMLRVSAKGLILIEPNDAQHKYSTYPTEGSYYDNFEETKNYLYRFSLREILKIATSLHLRYVLTRGFNDPWREDFKFDEWVIERESLDSLGRENIRQFDLMATLVITDPGIVITPEERKRLEAAHYLIYELPQLSER